MTSTTGTDEHPDVAEISALTEGVLPPERSADLRDHLTGCGLCTDVRRSLDEIRALLGTLPGPVRMPEDIAGRIDAALAAEALISATAHETSAAVSGGVTAAGADVSRETAAAARRPGGRPAGTTGPGRTGQRRRWVHAVLATAFATAVVTGASFAVHSLTSEGTPTTPSTAAPSVPAFSGVELPVRVHQLLASASPKSGAQTTQGGNPMHLDLATVPACVLSGTGRTGEPLASTRGSYNGHDAYLVVLPHTADPGRVDAYVVDASCDAAGTPTPGRLLAQQTYSRD